MTDNEILNLVKVDLQLSVNAYDALIAAYIQSAKEAIKTEGITLDSDSVADCELVEQYAAWLLRKRKEDVPMSRMLRWQLNNRLLSEKMGAD